MRLVAFGVLAAMVGAGCAFQPGDPGDVTDPPAEHTAIQTATEVHAATINAASSAAPPNPEPSPWNPTGPDEMGLNNGSDNSNPEPSPWHPTAPSGGTPGDPESSGGSGSTSGTAGGSTPNSQAHLGAP